MAVLFKLFLLDLTAQPQNGLSYTTTSESSLEKMRKADSGRPF
jgi:hypothetical protein